MSLLTTSAGMSEEREAWAYDRANAYHRHAADGQPHRYRS
jgi:hypothetical protein